jgi:hypothetical protein
VRNKTAEKINSARLVLAGYKVTKNVKAPISLLCRYIPLKLPVLLYERLHKWDVLQNVNSKCETRPKPSTLW